MKIFNRIDINPTNINLYYAAFTHTSFSNENPSFANYERLEFLGDAVLELIVSDYLYKERHLEEGVMTKLRASYVCEKALARYATDLHFEDDIKLGSGEKGPNNTILADIFEAFVGACYLDKGFEFTKELILGIITKYMEEDIDFLQDYKSKLQELAQTYKKTVTYKIIDEKGPAHDKTFTCQVLINGVNYGKAKGNSKKNAEQAAAKIALTKEDKIRK